MRWIPVGLIVSILAAKSVAALSSDDVLKKLSHAEIEAQLPAEDPSNYYLYAGRLMKEGDEPSALMWVYVAQLRYRIYLQAHHGADTSLYASLNMTIGGPLNRYGMKHFDLLMKAIDAALVWDDQHENTFTPKAQFADVYAKERAGLVKLKETFTSRRVEFEAAASGQALMPKEWAPLRPIQSTKELEGVFVHSAPLPIANVLIPNSYRKFATEFEIQAISDDRILTIGRNQHGETARAELQVRLTDGAAKFDLPAGFKGAAYIRRTTAGDLVLERDMTVETGRPGELEPQRLWDRATLKAAPQKD